MIEIDRNADIPLQVQIANSIRFKIGNGNIKKGDRLPATRLLASQLGISFHTVRKAYADLAEEGIITSRPGSGYVVENAEPLAKSDRMERGASILSSAIRQAVGLGLDEEELEYLFAEQLQALDAEETPTKLLVATSFKELGQQCAIQLASSFQRECHSCTLDELSKHADADILVVPFRYVKDALSINARADVIGFRYDLDEDTLGIISRLMDAETLGLVTRHADAIGPLTVEIRSLTKFAGSIMAFSVEAGDANMSTVIRECDLLIYTSGAERSVRPMLERAKKHSRLAIKLSESTIERIRAVLP